MKYLITESQFEKVIFKYLDNQDFIKMNPIDDYIYWNRSDYENGIPTIVISTHKKSICFINAKLVNFITSFFGLDRGEAMNIIGDWVERETGFEFNNILIS